jgi:AcrR family transcriptional regulator
MRLAREATRKLSLFTLSAPKSSRPSRSRATPRATYHHGDLRNALIAAALALIAEHGVEGFTLRDCARKAGVSVAAPYRHFTDRDDLLAAVAADCMVRLGDAMERAVEAAGTDDPLAVFRATGIAYVRFAVEHPAHFRVMNMPQVIARTPPELHAEVEAWGRDMTEKLAAAQRAGAIADLPLDDIMLAASCITHGLAHMIVNGVNGLDEVDPDTAAKLAITVTGALGYGLLPRTGADAELAKLGAAVPGQPRRKPARGGRTAIVLGVIALGAARADAKPIVMTASGADFTAADPAKPGDHGHVVASEFPARPVPGTYWVIGTKGPLGVIAVDGSTEHRGACPYQINAPLVDEPAWHPGDADHVVVVGPVDPAATAKPRLLLLGLASAGHLASEADEPLGVAPPPNGATFAIDLDGDGVGDLVTDSSMVHGRFVRGVARVKRGERVWRRHGKRWASVAQCRWTEEDTIE